MTTSHQLAEALEAHLRSFDEYAEEHGTELVPFNRQGAGIRELRSLLAAFRAQKEQAEPAACVSRSNDMEGLVQWAAKRIPVGTLLYTSPQSERDAADAARLDTLERLLADGTLTIKTVHFLSAASRVQIAFCDEEPVGDSFTLREAIDAAMASEKGGKKA